jgi:hypothetical protein
VATKNEEQLRHAFTGPDGKGWTPQFKSAMRQLAESDWTDKQIAAKLSISVSEWRKLRKQTL